MNNKMIKACAASVLIAGLSFSMVAMADTTTPAPAMTTKSAMPTKLVPMKMHYQDAKGNMRETKVYVPAKKAEELKKAKKVELMGCLGFCGPTLDGL